MEGSERGGRECYRQMMVEVGWSEEGGEGGGTAGGREKIVFKRKRKQKMEGLHMRVSVRGINLSW